MSRCNETRITPKKQIKEGQELGISVGGGGGGYLVMQVTQNSANLDFQGEMERTEEHTFQIHSPPSPGVMED